MQIDPGMVAIALAGLSFCGALGCIIALVRTRHALHEQQEEVSGQLDRMNQKLATLAAQPAEPKVAISIKPTTPSSEPVAAADELLAAITAAAAAVAERKARLNAARQSQTEPEAQSAWSQQGRVVVQSSHNIVPRR